MRFAIDFDDSSSVITGEFPVRVDVKNIERNETTHADLQVSSAFRKGELNILWEQGEYFAARGGARVQCVQPIITFDPTAYFTMVDVSNVGDVYTTAATASAGDTFELPKFDFEFSQGKFKLDADFKIPVKAQVSTIAQSTPKAPAEPDEVDRFVHELWEKEIEAYLKHELEHPWISYKEFTESQGERHPKAPRPRV